MLIREIGTDGEFAAVLELLEDLNDGVASDEGRMRQNWAKMKQYPYYKVFIAEDEDRIVGTFCLLICENIGHDGKKFAILENVVIKSGVRGQGLGRKMLGEALELAKRENCYKLMLSSNSQRQDAHRFYESLGFKRHGISFLVEAGPHD